MDPFLQTRITQCGFCCLPSLIPIVFVEEFVGEENCKSKRVREVTGKHHLSSTWKVIQWPCRHTTTSAATAPAHVRGFAHRRSVFVFISCWQFGLSNCQKKDRSPCFLQQGPIWSLDNKRLTTGFICVRFERCFKTIRQIVLLQNPRPSPVGSTYPPSTHRHAVLLGERSPAETNPTTSMRLAILAQL